MGVLLSSTMIVQPLLAETLPTGASVASGSVSVATSDNSITVTQRTNQAVVNWNSFSIGQEASVVFRQPDSSSAILNRVTGTTSSAIAGSLSANGQVYLINPNGIAITSSGTVKVGSGFVASTLDISDRDFLGGNLSFSGTGASAGVVNDGVITIGRGGYGALLGGTVSNSGTIAVPLGKAALGAGERATLDFSGDGFLQVGVPSTGDGRDQGALIQNSGTISANGGLAVMKAATARELARQAINMSGVVEANTVSGKTGTIVLGGGEGGQVTVTGKVHAIGKSGRGGDVTITGKDITLKGTKISASGAAGGGTVKIGGDKQGIGKLQRAKTTAIDADSAGIRPVEARVTSSGAGMEAPEGAVEEADGWHYTPHLPPQRQVFLGASGATVGGWTLCAGDSCQVVGATAGAPLALWSDKDCSHPPEARP